MSQYVFSAVFVLLGIIAPTVCAHIVGGATELELVGYGAPFGFDGVEQYTDVWAQGDYAYLGSAASGVAILDLRTDTTAIPHVQTYAPPGGLEFQDVKVVGEVGYFSGSDGTHVVELTDPLTPTKLSRIDTALGGHANPRNSAVGGELLYQVDSTSPTIHVFDVSMPNSPTWVRSIDTEDSVGLFDVTLVGDQLFATGLGGNTYVYAVGNVLNEAAELLATVPSGVSSAHVSPRGDGSLMMVSHREIGGDIAAWDISELSSPILIEGAGASDFSFNSFSAGEVAVLETVAFVAWFEAGLQVIDLDAISTTGMQRIGLYNTSPDSSPLDGFVGASSVYPFLGADRVLVSDTKWGLYLLDATGVLPLSPIPGDYDNNFVVNIADYASWTARFGLPIAAADGNQNGIVDAADFSIWRDAAVADFSGGESQVVAEPSASASLAVASLLALASSRRVRDWGDTG